MADACNNTLCIPLSHFLYSLLYLTTVEVYSDSLETQNVMFSPRILFGNLLSESKRFMLISF